MGRVLVTGGQGYLGSVLVTELLAAGTEVVVVDNGLVPGVRLPGVTYVAGDVSLPGDWRSALSGVDAVVHLAAVVGDPACAVDEGLSWRVNHVGTVRVAEACRRAGVGRLVFASTCSNYGIADDEVDVDSPLDPISVYARTKVRAEQYLLATANTGLRPCVLRFATVHGLSPRMRFDLAVNVMTADAVRTGRITVHGGTQWRPFLHVRDAAAAMVRCVSPSAAVPSAVYNCGSHGENYRMTAVAETIAAEVAGAVVDVRPDLVDRRSYRVRFDRIADELAFTPRFRMADSVREIRDAMAAGRYADYQAPHYSNYLTAQAAAS